MLRNKSPQPPFPPPLRIGGSAKATVAEKGTFIKKVTPFSKGGFGGILLLSLLSSSAHAASCDLNNDSATNVSDVQLCSNQAINVTPCSTGDINQDSSCNVIDVQRVVNAALGGQCVQPAAGYPDASNTGVPAGTALTVMNGMTITTAGTIVENKDIRGCILVNAPNVIIRKSRISANCITMIDNGASQSGFGTNLLVEDSTLICSGGNGTAAISSQDYTARRVNVSNCENGLWADHNVLIEDSYIHDLIPYNPATDPHTDGVQIPTGGSNITIRHNRVYGGYAAVGLGNSAVGMGGSTSNITVANNLLAGGGYTLYCNQELHGSRAVNNFYTNNRFSTIFVSTVGGYGPTASCDDETNFTGNVYHETGAPL